MYYTFSIIRFKSKICISTWIANEVLPTAKADRSIPLIVLALGNGLSGCSGLRRFISGSYPVSIAGSFDVTYTLN